MDRYEREIRHIFRKGPLEVTENDCDRLYHIYERYELDLDDVYEFCRHVGLWKNIHDLNDENWKVRFNAIEELRESGDSRVVDPLINILEDEDYQWRIDSKIIAEIIRTLGEMREKRSVDSLIPFLHDDDDIVRINTAKALGKIKSKKATEPLLSVLLYDSIDNVRIHAALALGKIGDSRAVKTLIRFLQNDSEAFFVQGAVATALGNMKDSRAIEPLIEAMKNHKIYNVRYNAALSLKALGQDVDPEKTPLF